MDVPRHQGETVQSQVHVRAGIIRRADDRRTDRFTPVRQPQTLSRLRRAEPLEGAGRGARWPLEAVERNHWTGGAGARREQTHAETELERRWLHQEEIHDSIAGAFFQRAAATAASA
jgi:hypothetical protein